MGQSDGKAILNASTVGLSVRKSTCDRRACCALSLGRILCRRESTEKGNDHVDWVMFHSSSEISIWRRNLRSRLALLTAVKLSILFRRAFGSSSIPSKK